MKRTVNKQNVGIDISKDDFKVCFYQRFDNEDQRIKAQTKFNNSLGGFRKFHQWIERHRVAEIVVRLTVEATGVYYEQLAHYFYQTTDYQVSVVLPNKYSAYIRSLNLKSKTDKIDAQALGQMGLERNLTPWEPSNPEILIIKQLCRERVRLLDQKTVVQNQLHALKCSFEPNTATLERMQQMVDFIKTTIKSVEKDLQKRFNADADLKRRVENICVAKGLRMLTVITVIAETNGFKLFKNRSQVVSFVGYDVVENQSGKKNGKTRISKKGNKYIRRALHFPAITAVKHEPQFKQLQERVFERTRIPMKGYVAVQRKLLLLIYTLYKKNEAFDPNYQNKQNPKKESEILETAVHEKP